MDAVSRRMFLKAGAAAAATHALPDKAGAAHGKKNVLFISVDDLNHSLGCYGEPVKTPNLDALAARGTRFDAAYCQYPLCGPSRCSLMTGFAPDTTKCYDNPKPVRAFLPNAVTLPQVFRMNGYYSARVGKIYHAGNPMQEGEPGSDDAPSWEYTYNNAGLDRTEEIGKIVSLEPRENVNIGAHLAKYESPASDRQVTDGVGADEVIRLLKANKDKPFFLAFGLYRPHVPWIVPEAYFKQYPLETIHAEPLGADEMDQAPSAAYTSKANRGMDSEHARMCKAAYYASATYMDAQVGRVLDALKELGLDQNTVVVFWADHGWQLGQHGQWEKETVFEWAARVPFIMAGPGVKQGGVVKHTTEHLDIYPTLVELCGLEHAPKVHGQSMTALLSDPATSGWNKPAMTQVHRAEHGVEHTRGYSIRTERYRYTMWLGEVTGEELYDYQTDPREVKNRAKDASLADVKEKLKAQLVAMRAARTQTVT